MTKWMEDWFGSEYYSILYKHRDDKEAKLFLDNLIAFLKLQAQNKILDCGCGRGRHSIYLAAKGFDVTGIDMCTQNITNAKKNEKPNLTFFIHDMRRPFRENQYDAALNLFTSFGYFEDDYENNKMIKSIAGALKKNGWLVLDFMNAHKETKKLVCEEKINREGISFDIKRFTSADFIIKEIAVSEEGKNYLFREKVKAYTQKELENFFTQNKMEIVHLFGDYQLSKFDEASSGRLILVGRKI